MKPVARRDLSVLLESRLELGAKFEQKAIQLNVWRSPICTTTVAIDGTSLDEVKQRTCIEFSIHQKKERTCVQFMFKKSPLEFPKLRNNLDKTFPNQLSTPRDVHDETKNENFELGFDF